MNAIQDYRAFYASLIVRSTGSSNARLIAAFSSVEREHYVGKGPWQIAVVAGYIPTISDDPRLLYQDILVGPGNGSRYQQRTTKLARQLP